MCKEKKKDENSPALKMHQYEDLKTTLKRIKKDQLQRPVTILTTKGQREQQKLGNKNRKKNDCMNISSDKLTISHMRRTGHG